MNNDSIAADITRASLTQAALEQNLITALTRLQYTAFDKELLGSSVPLAADVKPHTYFGFGIGAYNFMVDASCFCEVLVDTEIASIPNAPSCLVGLSNVRGILMPIYQLHSALEVSLPKKLIIFAVGKGDAAVGILIDSLPISLLVSASQRQTVSKHENSVLQQLIASHYFSGQQHWLGLNGVELGAQLLTLANQTHKPHAYLSAGRELAYS